MIKNQVYRRIFVFSAFVVLLTAPLFFFPQYMNRQKSALGGIVMMLVPSMAMLLTRLVTQEGFGNMWLRFRKGGLRYLFGCWYGLLAIYILLIPLVYFLSHPTHFEWNISGNSNPWAFQLAIALTMLYFLFTLPLGLGEEWGWCGYLLPNLLELFSVIPAALISGLIWAVWHFPLIAVETENRIEFFLICTLYLVSLPAISMTKTYFTLKSGSIIVAAAIHMLHNGYLGFGMLFIASNDENQLPFVLWANITEIALGVVFGIRLYREEKRGLLCKTPAGLNTALGAGGEDILN